THRAASRSARMPVWPGSTACSRPAPTSAASRRAATRVAWRPRWCSAESPPRALSRKRLQVGAAPRVAGERGGRDLRHAKAPLVLLDLLADSGRIAVALAELVTVRRPDEAQVRVVLRLPVLHGRED